MKEFFKQEFKYSVIKEDGTNGITGTTYFWEAVADDDQPCFVQLQFQ